MVGIAGLLAKRKHAAAGGVSSKDTSTTSPPQHKPCDVTAIADSSSVKDTYQLDPFTFDERPGTSGSYSFSVGAYMDSEGFENYDDCDPNQNSMECALMGKSPPKSIGGLFRRATEKALLAQNASSTSPADKTCVVHVASKVFPVPHDAASVTFGKDMGTCSMPPPPPRTLAVHENSDEHSAPKQKLEEVTVMSRSATSFHDIQHHHLIDVRPVQDIVEASTTNADRNDFVEYHVVATNPCPAFVLETPAKVSISRELTKAEAAPEYDFASISVEHRLPFVTPPSRVLEHSDETRTIDMRSVINDTSDQPHYDRIVREEGFDEMHIHFLQDSQDVRDKYLNSEEQILEMEVYLEHVIAMINADILQMQEMEDELNEVEEAHEAILAMCRE
jgi:hypothetical protein